MLDYWVVSDTARHFIVNPRTVLTPWKANWSIAFDWVPNARVITGLQHTIAGKILSERNLTCTIDKMEVAEEA